MSRELQILIDPEATISKMEMVQSEGDLDEEVVVSKMEMTTEYGAFNKTQRIACDFDAVVKAIGKKGGEA